jgi:hypothetical protein
MQHPFVTGLEAALTWTTRYPPHCFPWISWSRFLHETPGMGISRVSHFSFRIYLYILHTKSNQILETSLFETEQYVMSHAGTDRESSRYEMMNC